VIPVPVWLTPLTWTGGLAIACPEDGCRWHAHAKTEAEAMKRYTKHYEENH
jgi:hypothetical protein